eukprot:scaffold551156_cov44-Prasinocladus_malaysianus.AAC.1
MEVSELVGSFGQVPALWREAGAVSQGDIAGLFHLSDIEIEAEHTARGAGIVGEGGAQVSCSDETVPRQNAGQAAGHGAGVAGALAAA